MLTPGDIGTIVVLFFLRELESDDVNSRQREQDGVVYHTHLCLLISGTFDYRYEAV